MGRLGIDFGVSWFFPLSPPVVIEVNSLSDVGVGPHLAAGPGMVAADQNFADRAKILESTGKNRKFAR